MDPDFLPKIRAYANGRQIHLHHRWLQYHLLKVQRSEFRYLTESFEHHQVTRYFLDPHTWLDPEKAGEEAQIIADKLSEVDSEHKETYQKNAQAFIKKSSRID